MPTDCSIPRKSTANRFNFEHARLAGLGAARLRCSGARDMQSSTRRRAGAFTVTHGLQRVLALVVLIALPITAAQSQSAERAPDTMAARVLACASCHGGEGEGTND